MSEILQIASIRLDGGTQPRAAINPEILREYTDAISDGAIFPEVIVFYDGTSYWLADGFHRITAASACGHVEFPAEVRQGTQRDAILCSVGVNAQHGLRRTNADKRRAVETLLRDAEWGQWSNREIARRCGVHHDMVDQARKSLCKTQSGPPRPAPSPDGPVPPPPGSRTYVNRHGGVSTMQTANIGKRASRLDDGIVPPPPPARPQPRPAPTTDLEAGLQAMDADAAFAAWLRAVDAAAALYFTNNDTTVQESYRVALAASWRAHAFTVR
jgi:hypothetical protein